MIITHIHIYFVKSFSILPWFEYPNHGKPSFLWRNDSLSDCRYKINCSMQKFNTFDPEHSAPQSLHKWQSGPTHPPPTFYEKNAILPILSLLFQILSNPFSCCLRPQRTLLFLLSCFLGWMGDRATFDVLLCLMMLWIYTWCRALTP